MKIYTRKGDEGKTGLFGGARIDKDDVQIEAYGTVDELNSWIGIVIDQIDIDNVKQYLIKVQSQLFAFGSVLATAQGKSMPIAIPGTDAIDEMEKQIDAMEDQLPELKNFVLPSGYFQSSFTHVARCVCRRAERRIVSLSRIFEMDPILIQYFNRLSDYLFVLARYLSFRKGVVDVLWDPEHIKK